MKMLRAFAHCPFALLWSGRTVSRLGDSFYTIALAWWVLRETGSATAMGLVLICSTLPMIACLLFGGVVVDRFPRVRIMLASDLLRGGVVGLIALLAYLNMLALWHLLVLSAVFGVVDAFFYPAERAILPDLVPDDLLPAANSLASVSTDGAGFIGPALAGATIALGGTSLAFALDGLSFLVSAACLLALPRVSAPSQVADRDTGILGDVREGLREVARSPWLWVTLVVASVSTIFLVGPIEAALPLLVKQRFGERVGFFALLTALSALGSVLAAIWLGRFARLRRRGYLTYGPWMLASVALLVMGLPLPIGVVGAAFLVQGAAFAALGLAWTNSLQAFVPADLLGRVSSIDYLVSSALLPIGYGLAGVAADHLGAAPVFVAGGAIAAGVIALGLVHPQVRAVD